MTFFASGPIFNAIQLTGMIVKPQIKMTDLPSFFTKDRIFHCLVTVCIVVWLAVNRRLEPFYFNWDTDASVIIDLILIHSGQLPEHINHPSFGLFMLFSFVFSAIDLLTPAVHLGLSLSDFAENCPDPLLCLSNTTALVQAITRLFFGASIAFFTISFARAFQSRILAGFVLLALLFDEGVHYSLHILKSEGFSLCFFLIAAGCLMNYATTRQRAYFLIGAVFAGLVFFTKAQFVIYSVYFCCMAALLPEFRASSRTILIASVLVFLGCAGFGSQALLNFDNGNALLGTLSVLSPLYAITLAILFVLCVINAFPSLARFRTSATDNLQIAALASFSSIFLSLVLNGPIFGSQLSAQAIASTLMRSHATANYILSNSYDIFLEPTRLFVMATWIGLTAYASALAIRHLKVLAQTKTLFSVLVIVLFILPILNPFVSFRDLYRDLMPAKSLLMVSGLLSLGLIYKLGGSNRFQRAITLFAFASSVLFCQFSLQREAMPNLVAENAHYGASPYRFHTGAYGGNHDLFKSALASAGVDTNKAPARWLSKASNGNYRSLLPNVRRKCLLDTTTVPDNDSGDLMSIGYFWAASQTGFYKIDESCLKDIKMAASWFFTEDNWITYPLANYRTKMSEPVIGQLELMPRRDMRTVIVSPRELEIEWLDFYQNYKPGYLPEMTNETKNINGQKLHLYLIERYARVPITESVYVGFYPST